MATKWNASKSLQIEENKDLQQLGNKLKRHTETIINKCWSQNDNKMECFKVIADRKFFFFCVCLEESTTSWARARVTRGRVIQPLPL
jgi:hypothetical protein